jgi:hypothetical protein
MINEAMAAAGALGHDSLVLPLLKIVENSKNLGVAARAVTALGKFRDSAFSRRKKILLDLTDTLMKDMPGGPSQGKENRQTGDYIPGKSGHGGSARYATLAPLIPQALNELTGQEFQTLEEWMRVVSEQKRNLQDLFLERDEEEEKKDKKRA